MDSDIGAISGNFFVRAHVPQCIVLPRAHAVICRGHTTSVLGALTHGLPSLLMLNGSGTEDITERCRHAGAAISLAPSMVTAETLQHAVDTLLHCSSLRRNAQALQQAFPQVHGLARAADLLEQLAVTRHPVLRQLHQPYAV
jgi:UDP:flavonoid glycosyltransferase YjiC (YdhE family)